MIFYIRCKDNYDELIARVKDTYNQPHITGNQQPLLYPKLKPIGKLPQAIDSVEQNINLLTLIPLLLPSILCFLVKVLMEFNVITYSTDPINIFLVTAVISILCYFVHYLINPNKDIAIFFIITIIGITYSFLCSSLNILDIKSHMLEQTFILLMVLLILIGLVLFPNILKCLIYTIAGILSLLLIFAILHNMNMLSEQWKVLQESIKLKDSNNTK